MNRITSNIVDNKRFIKAPRDFWGGAALAAFAIFVYWSAANLGGMRGFSFGPGTAPRLCSLLLMGVSGVMMIGGLLRDGPPLERWSARAPFFLILSVFSFAIMIRPIGLVVTSVVCFMLAALSTQETKFVESIILSVVLTIFCALLFPIALGLSLPLWPHWYS